MTIKDANDIDVNKWRTKLGVGSGGGGGAPVDSYTKSEADNKFANKTDLDNYTKKMTIKMLMALMLISGRLN